MEAAAVSAFQIVSLTSNANVYPNTNYTYEHFETIVIGLSAPEAKAM
jgi:hypothetical protein